MESFSSHDLPTEVHQSLAEDVLQDDQRLVQRVSPDGYAKVVRSKRNHARSGNSIRLISLSEEEFRVECLSLVHSPYIIWKAKTYCNLDRIGMTNKRYIRVPSFSLDDRSDEHWSVHSV